MLDVLCVQSIVDQSVQAHAVADTMHNCNLYFCIFLIFVTLCQGTEESNERKKSNFRQIYFFLQNMLKDTFHFIGSKVSNERQKSKF